MADAVLNSLKPDLVIFDEFQKFKDVTAVDRNDELQHELGKVLMQGVTPVLLLSATPYRLVNDFSDYLESNGEAGHYKDLMDTFSFLCGKKKSAQKTISLIREYGNLLGDLSYDNLPVALEKKKQIQDRVMRFMCRAERINFEGERGKGLASTEERYMSEQVGGKEITKENILEFLHLSQHVNSNRTLLSYWKSGVTSMSYMSGYQLISAAMDKSRKNARSLTLKKELYTPLMKIPSQHLKVRYISQDIAKDGESFRYLWMPPIHPYYAGSGVFADKEVAQQNPKKGLVFSSWLFVPRMLAAEICSIRSSHMIRVKDVSELKPSRRNWAELFFPSTLLAGVLSHNDFVSAKSYRHLLGVAKRNLRAALSKDYVIKKKGASVPAWRVLYDGEFNGSNEAAERSRLYGKMLRRSSKEVASNVLPTHGARLDSITEAVIHELAEIAISSPAVCIYRSLLMIRQKPFLSAQWIKLAAFAIDDIRSFVNRPGHRKIIRRYERGNSQVERTVNYFRHGNFQSVMDEYLCQVFHNRSDKGLEAIIQELSLIFGPIKAHAKVNISSRRTKRVYYDIACSFGAGVEDSNSRDQNRVAFNSPFWPFLLATTSVGQEGLDFHLYCKDIYHWNLPSNPVAFEQREGRINRFNSFMIRQNVARIGQSSPFSLELGETVWSKYFDIAHKHSHRNDRYNLEMSPNWVFTPVDGKSQRFVRHVMDLPCSNDKARYDRLMKDLNLYRLALGQPDQYEFLDKVRNNSYYEQIDTRGIALNFFPYATRDRVTEMEKYWHSRDAVETLIEDCKDYLGYLTDDGLHAQLVASVNSHVDRVQDVWAGSNGASSDDDRFRYSVYALHYFVDPFDLSNDRTPSVGMQDDLEVLHECLNKSPSSRIVPREILATTVSP
jgi:hypothetical protein